VKQVPLIAAINDLSGFGRCSLTVAIPILSSMGYQVCPMPTALLSAHTGYPDPQVRDFTADMGAFLAHWKKLGLSFDAVFSGFLGNAAQVDLLVPFMREHKEHGALCVVDPAMADHGRLYAGCTFALVEEMRRLVSLADVTTPNLTEACLLTDTPYTDVVDEACVVDCKRLQTVGEQLLLLGCGSAVITGVHNAADSLENWVFERNAAPTIVRTDRVGQNFAGTGDVFSSVLCGEMMQGKSLYDAVECAATFVREVTSYTAEIGTPLQDGVMFEPFLDRLREQNDDEE
jgi:pyridoxine kinase